mgnify:FL=1
MPFDSGVCEGACLITTKIIKMNRNKIFYMLYEEIRNKSKTASDYGMCDIDIEDISNFVIDFLTEAELLLLNHAPEASAETPAVRQNEQEKKVCTYCVAQNSCKRSHCIKCLKWIG